MAMRSEKLRELQLVYGRHAPLGRRFQDVPINGPEHATDVLRAIGCKGPEESFGVIYCDVRMKPLGFSVFTMGATDEAAINAGGIMRRALLCGASRLIVGHNHPSGELSASPADKSAMRSLRKAAALLNLEVADALILADSGEHLSFQKEGLMMETTLGD